MFEYVKDSFISITKIALYTGENYFMVDLETKDSRVIAAYIKKNRKTEAHQITPYMPRN